jgi:hypothetical protein
MLDSKESRVQKELERSRECSRWAAECVDNDVKLQSQDVRPFPERQILS